MVKTVSAKKRLIVALVAFAASLFMAAGLTFRARAEGESATQFRVKGASVRYVDNAYTPAVKFHVLLDKATFDGLSDSAETGLKLCPTKLLNGESLATSESAQVVTKTAAKTDWKVSETDAGMMELVVFVYDIPDTDYGTDIKVAGYITDGGKTTYTEAKNDTFSLAYVAKEAATLEPNKAAQLAGYYKFDFKAYDLSEKLIGSAQTVEYGSALTQPAPSSVLTCGWYNKSKTQRWDFSTDAVRGNVSLYEVEHTFNADGVCSLCNKHAKELLIVPEDANALTVNADAGKGTYSLAGKSDDDVYAVIPGKILTVLKDLGYGSLNVTAVNPAGYTEGDTAMHKTLCVAADNKNNLWKAETAIAYYDWKKFWDNGRRADFAIDLNKYAGRNIYIYTNKTKTYPLGVTVKEFASEDKSAWLFSATGDGSTVEYYEGKGWTVTTKTTAAAWYATISKDIIKHYVDRGYTSMVITYVSSFDGVDNSNESDITATCSRLLPKKADGSEDWQYNLLNNTPINKLPQGNGGYLCAVNLTDPAYDFTTKDPRFVFESTGKVITRGYIKDIEFTDYYTDKRTWVSPYGKNSAVTYMDGKGWEIKSTDGNGWECAISAKIIKHYVAMGYTTMNITYVDNFSGVDNPNVGSFVHSKSRIIPYKAGGGEDWKYFPAYGDPNGKGLFISGLPAGNGGYVCTVDLIDPAYDFVTKDSRIYFNNLAVGDKPITCAYIKDIEFVKGTLPNA